MGCFIPSILSEELDDVGVTENQKESLFFEGSSNDHGRELFLAKEILKTTDITIQEAGEPGKGARFLVRIAPGATPAGQGDFS